MNGKFWGGWGLAPELDNSEALSEVQNHRVLPPLCSGLRPQTHPPCGSRVAAAAPEVTVGAAVFSGRRGHLLLLFFRGDHLFLSLLERKKTFPQSPTPFPSSLHPHLWLEQ